MIDPLQVICSSSPGQRPDVPLVHDIRAWLTVHVLLLLMSRQDVMVVVSVGDGRGRHPSAPVHCDDRRPIVVPVDV